MKNFNGKFYKPVAHYKKNVNSITVRTVLGFTKENMNCVKGLEI